jgi:hypothetical protein
MFIEEQKADWSFWRGALAGGVFVALTLTALGKITKGADHASAVDMPKDIIQAYNMGLKDALRTNPVSLELDQTCLALWAGKQPVR